MNPDLYADLRHDLFRVCAFIAANSLLCNFLPKSTCLKRFPKLRYGYEILIDLIAGFALNWRIQLPSLDQEFIGFRRAAKHAIRNWKQNHMDKEQC